MGKGKQNGNKDVKVANLVLFGHKTAIKEGGEGEGKIFTLDKRKKN
jgi:hypothetical protein